MRSSFRRTTVTHNGAIRIFPCPPALRMAAVLRQAVETRPATGPKARWQWPQ